MIHLLCSDSVMDLIYFWYSWDMVMHCTAAVTAAGLGYCTYCRYPTSILAGRFSLARHSSLHLISALECVFQGVI